MYSTSVFRTLIQLLWLKINTNNFNFSFPVPSSEYSIVSLDSTLSGLQFCWRGAVLM